MRSQTATDTARNDKYADEVSHPAETAARNILGRGADLGHRGRRPAGNAAIAEHQIAFRAWTLLAFALDAIAIAGQAITGRYLGAGDVTGARAATNRMIGWGVAYGVMFRIVLVAAIPLLPAVFSAAPDVRRLLPAVLLMAAAQQPVAGVVFVLDGVLIGAGDQDYLALAGLAAAGLAAAGVFAVGATLVIAQHAGLVAL